MATTHTTNYVDTFIAVADDCAATAGTVPPARAQPSIAELTYAMIAEHPYRYTSDDVIFTVWADRRGIEPADRPAARARFFGTGQPCLRSSDLGKRYGWGVHADSGGRVALYPIESAEYALLSSGTGPAGDATTVTRAMRSRRSG
ncbi:DUF6157 family protein [Pengzhenrongella sicca]|uniref:Uncharacterized protein n=1 Tax=Pengzhenrongella sicca TaxID=2819238 RepID=A0A8A4ZBP8_9MICO|nr:DUF6157 family protein [Pengzhenrongella sicca]QTE29342.1 hypothetical protein J4E96_19060 [Pengzhenrongella sicca]